MNPPPPGTRVFIISAKSLSPNRNIDTRLEIGQTWVAQRSIHSDPSYRGKTPGGSEVRIYEEGNGGGRKDPRLLSRRSRGEHHRVQAREREQGGDPIH